jgi:hypothetical protein
MKIAGGLPDTRNIALLCIHNQFQVSFGLKASRYEKTRRVNGAFTIYKGTDSAILTTFHIEHYLMKRNLSADL